MFVLVYTMQLHSWQKQPNLKFKTQSKQLLVYLPLTFAFPGQFCLNKVLSEVLLIILIGPCFFLKMMKIKFCLKWFNLLDVEFENVLNLLPSLLSMEQRIFV